MLVIELPLPSRKLCGNALAPVTRGGHIARNKRVAEHRYTAKLTGLEHRGAFPEGRVAVRILVTYTRLWSTRRLDDDNFWRGMKPYLDGLQDAGVVANDRQFYHVGPVAWLKVPVGQPTGVQLGLTPDP